MSRARTLRLGASWVLASLLALLGGLAQATVATAQNTNVYWTDSGSGVLSLGSSLSTTPMALFTGLGEPADIALQPNAAQIYWAEPATGRIMVGPIAGGGAPQALYTEPEGARPTAIAINAAAGVLYWTDQGSGEIRVGSITGGSPAATLFSEAGAEPDGLAVNSGAEKVFWADRASAKIQVGSTTGGIATTLFSEPAGAEPSGLAYVSGTGSLYWTDEGSGRIQGASTLLTSAKTLYTDEGGAPRGIAVNTTTGVLYWADAATGLLREAGVKGAGAVSTLFSGEAKPSYPALLGPPLAQEAPKITGAGASGATLSCSKGEWGTNSPGANFFQAPQSYAYQWQLGGVAIAGAESARYKPTANGSYTCLVTATNLAGSATMSSSATVIGILPPSATIASPVSGGTYKQGALVKTAFACTEGAGGTGLESCTDSMGASAPGGVLETATPGTFTYTVTAVSKDGLQGTASITYTVLASPTAPASAPKIEIVSHSSQVSGRSTAIALSCESETPCHGELSLTYTGNGAHKKVTLLIARTLYALGEEARWRVPLRITAQARGLLAKAPGRHLTVSAQVTLDKGASSSRNVVLRMG